MTGLSAPHLIRDKRLKTDKVRNKKSLKFSGSVVSDSLRPRGLQTHHQLPDFTQTRVHRVGDAFQLSHPLSSHAPTVFNPSQHQGLFQ